MIELINDANNYPTYSYTYEIVSINAQSGNAGIIVKYVPDNSNLTSISYNIPILHNFDINDLPNYVDRWAPRQQWFAQEIVLSHANTILSSSTANTVFQN